MSSTGKNILRIAIVGIYVLIVALGVYAVGSIYTYLNTGADRSKMLHTELKQVEVYLPKLTWRPLNNKGRLMDTQTLKSIEKDYLNAWYVKHVAYEANLLSGIEDYYTENARQHIYDIVNLNIKNEVTLEETTLSHNPQLEFFSEDGQFAVLTDNDVIEYKRIYKNEKLIAEVNEKSTYKVMLLLEDGFWRIRHINRVKSEIFKPEQKSDIIKIDSVKGINYYPKNSPWQMYGDTFNADTITKDFKLIKASGLNSVRIFVPYDDFGKGEVKSEKLEKLEIVLDLAETAKLNVVVTLFDFYGDYSVLDWTLNQAHAREIVNALKDKKALLAWDIKNEPNLDFESRGKALVKAWLSKMIVAIKVEDSEHAVTIGWSNAESAAILKDELDYVSFHYYEDLETLETIYKTLKTHIKNKPIVISEFGISSNSGFWNPLGNSEQNQADYHKTVQKIFADNDVQFMSWTLYDFDEIPKEVVGRLPWRQNTQRHFGFINRNGGKKLSYKYISKK